MSECNVKKVNATMKKYIVILLTFLTSLSVFSGCDSFLDVENIDELSGNVFWKDKEDVEGFTLSIYFKLREAVMQNSAFFPATGDLRCAPVVPSFGDRQFDYLRSNDLGTLIAQYYGDYVEITRWDKLYEVISSANILLEEVDNMDAGALTDIDARRYKAEGIFMRNLAYFFLVRLYGDVPYYIEAYNVGSLPRLPMVEVLQNCSRELEDMLTSDVDASVLPWTYEDASKVSVRAMRGSVIALMMHINLWLAGFDENNASTYYSKIVVWGKDITLNGRYELLDLDRTRAIFSGGSKESLFEIVQDINSNETFKYDAVFSNYMIPRGLGNNYPRSYYMSDFLTDIYPPAETDNRATTWFKNIYASDVPINYDDARWFVKFMNTYTDPDGNFTSNKGNQVIFRYADVLLMYAEASAKLGGDNEIVALDMLNEVRHRAGAEPASSSGTELQDAIYWERVRELIGEGQYFYDLVRTHKIYNSAFCYYPISRSTFDKGAWTWPIHKDALLNNPYMRLNQYWN
ncbi:RagB/SusD family nutrient uptake outer membrane protein [Sunxiuqinia indica]|uniref:RagB/SusD family nutrient uptake outer membrane protein n=1 Tax=Sunxiuqinia indica TaxID=2692584 RepID=UPI00135B4B3E|nr:RagB/SusD family nutrient uptake outer membrane protein [Sunxiuqinia indica]